MKSIETCLLLSPDDKYALHLSTLLLTAKKQMPQAYAQIYQATNHYPDIRFLSNIKFLIHRKKRQKVYDVCSSTFNSTYF